MQTIRRGGDRNNDVWLCPISVKLGWRNNRHVPYLGSQTLPRTKILIYMALQEHPPASSPVQRKVQEKQKEHLQWKIEIVLWCSYHKACQTASKWGKGNVECCQVGIKKRRAHCLAPPILSILYQWPVCGARNILVNEENGCWNADRKLLTAEK